MSCPHEVGPALRAWDVATGKLARAFGRDSERITKVAVSPDGTRLASGCSHHILGREYRDCAVRV